MNSFFDTFMDYFTMTPEKLRRQTLEQAELSLEKAEFAYENAEADIALLKKRIARLKGTRK